MALPLPNAWTETELAILLRLWDEGKSAGEIALVLGRTRNAVVGRVHRERGRLRRDKGWHAAEALSREAKAPKIKAARREALAKTPAKPRTPPAPRTAPISIAPLRAVIFTAPIEPIEEIEAPIDEVAPAPAVAPDIGTTIAPEPAPEPAPRPPAPAPLRHLYFHDETWPPGRCRAPLFADKVAPDAPVFCGAYCEPGKSFCAAHQRIFYTVPVRPEKGREPIPPAPRGRR